MIRTLKRLGLFLIAPLVLALPLGLPAALGQPLGGRYDPYAQEPKEKAAPAAQYSLAMLSIIVVLVVLCMPSRKRSVDS